MGLALLPVAVYSGDVVLEYQRADGAFAGSGQPSPSLGTERVVVAPGAIAEFETDWKFEKTKGTAGSYYGSHLRVAKNTSDHVITLFLRLGPTNERQEILLPGVSKKFKADLIAVEAAPQPLSAADLAKRCVFEYRRADNAGNQAGLPSNSLGAETVTLRPGERVIFDTNWSHEKKKGTAAQRYGSHLRRAVNKGEGTVVRVRSVANFAAILGQGMRKALFAVFRRPEEGGRPLEYNVPADFKSDLISIDCLLP
jgi:hypothetical protein